MDRRDIPSFILLCVLCVCAVQPAALAEDAKPQAAGGRPNIVVILADDLGFGDLSSYGAKDLKSPHVDKLASRGMRFVNAYANCTVCSPSRAAMLTGRYPDLVGVPGVIRTNAADNWGYLSPSAVLLPTMLKGAGYHTAIVGKWHLGLEPQDTPSARGFDEFRGFLGDMMDDYVTHRRHGINYMRHNDQVITPKGHATDLFTDWAVEYIKGRAAAVPNGAASGGQPFFLYLAYNAPHTPIQPPADWLAKVQRREPGMSDKRAKMVALIEHMDDGIGRVMAAIDEAGIADNTLVIFASDNGGDLGPGASNGRWRDGKGSMYEGGLRVPLVAAWPGVIEAGTQTDQIAMSMDLFATCCAAAGVKVEHAIEGVDLTPTLRGHPQNIQRDLVWMRREGNMRFQGQMIWAARRGPWKLVQNTPEEAMQLFNLDADPLETADVREKEKAKFRELSELLRLHTQRAGAVAWQRGEK